MKRNEKRVQNLDGNSDEKKTFGRTRRRWKVNIMIDLKDVQCESVNSTELAQDTFKL
jgi:ribosomal protein L28